LGCTKKYPDKYSRFLINDEPNRKNKESLGHIVSKETSPEDGKRFFS
jgi:hypothetical protein